MIKHLLEQPKLRVQFQFDFDSSLELFVDTLKMLLHRDGRITLAQAAKVAGCEYQDADELLGWVDLESLQLSQAFYPITNEYKHLVFLDLPKQLKQDEVIQE